MIIPSRWMFGGKGLDDFRTKMINDKHFLKLNDYLDPKMCFPSNDIKGGVCFFIWNKDYNGKTEITTYSSNKVATSFRYLKEENADIYIRDNNLINILNKVKAKKEDTFDRLVQSRKSYGLEASTLQNPEKFGLPPLSTKKIDNSYDIYGLDDKMKRVRRYLSKEYQIPKISPCLNKYKVFIAKAYGCGAIGEVPSTPVLSTPVLSTPGQLCTETFLEIGPFDDTKSAENVIKYIHTKFFRCLVGIQKQTQNTSQKVYRFVPILNFKDNSEINWDLHINEIDKILFKRYELNQEEIDFIEENIQEMK